ncbi:MAG TPA: succinate dehydrogenase, cytochrome b556 subunit [Anaerolineae bacterium]|nr:succinate dehydrogenase, cytochrome b556 subunit [Anaerolineae bacterium]
MAVISHIFRDVTYRGREGQIAFMLHRVTGAGVFLFLTLHIVNTFLMVFPAHVFNSVLVFYHAFVFKLVIIFGLYLGLLYHALNGIRIVIVDFVPGAARYQAPLWRIQVVIFLAVYVPTAAILLARML